MLPWLEDIWTAGVEQKSSVDIEQCRRDTYDWCAVMRDDGRSAAPEAARDVDGTKYEQGGNNFCCLFDTLILRKYVI